MSFIGNPPSVLTKLGVFTPRRLLFPRIAAILKASCADRDPKRHLLRFRMLTDRISFVSAPDQKLPSQPVGWGLKLRPSRQAIEYGVPTAPPAGLVSASCSPHPRFRH